MLEFKRGKFENGKKFRLSDESLRYILNKYYIVLYSNYI